VGPAGYANVGQSLTHSARIDGGGGRHLLVAAPAYL